MTCFLLRLGESTLESGRKYALNWEKLPCNDVPTLGSAYVAPGVGI